MEVMSEAEKASRFINSNIAKSYINKDEVYIIIGDWDFRVDRDEVCYWAEMYDKQKRAFMKEVTK